MLRTCCLVAAHDQLALIAVAAGAASAFTSAPFALRSERQTQASAVSSLSMASVSVQGGAKIPCEK